jgi:thioredoxin reductase
LSNITPNITVLDLSNSYKDNNYNVYNNVIISKIYGDKFVEGIELNSNNKIINIDCEGIFITIGREYNQQNLVET